MGNRDNTWGNKWESATIHRATKGKSQQYTGYKDNTWGNKWESMMIWGATNG